MKKKNVLVDKEKKVGILVRVYNRIDDLVITLRLLKDTWDNNQYDIFVISNGVSHGYTLSQTVYELADKVICLDKNAGHLKGSSQLLMAGMEQMPLTKYDYIIILEADTWIYGDSLISKYIKLMQRKNAVWASARWYDRFHSLATDFAIIDAKYLQNNKELFNFTYFPECHMANYLRDHNGKYIYIKENMQTLIPSYIHFEWPYSRKGRFNCFHRGKMVTHHVEDYKDGFITKKQEFNAVAGICYFEDVPAINLPMVKILIGLSHFVQSTLPKRSWTGNRCYLDIDARMRYVESLNQNE